MLKTFSLDISETEFRYTFSFLAFLWKSCPKDFAKFTRKHPCGSLLKKVIGIVIGIVFLLYQKIFDVFKNHIVTKTSLDIQCNTHFSFSWYTCWLILVAPISGEFYIWNAWKGFCGNCFIRFRIVILFQVSFVSP